MNLNDPLGFDQNFELYVDEGGISDANNTMTFDPLVIKGIPAGDIVEVDEFSTSKAKSTSIQKKNALGLIAFAAAIWYLTQRG